VHDVQSKRVTESDHRRCLDVRTHGSSPGEQEADGNHDERSEVTGQRTGNSNVDERRAVRNAAADLDDRACGAAEGRSRKHPWECGANPVESAGEIMAEFVGKKNGQ